MQRSLPENEATSLEWLSTKNSAESFAEMGPLCEQSGIGPRIYIFPRDFSDRARNFYLDCLRASAWIPEDIRAPKSKSAHHKQQNRTIGKDNKCSHVHTEQCVPPRRR